MPKGIQIGGAIPCVKGPGGYLKDILAERGYIGSAGCGCGSKAMDMDAWGPDGCRRNMAQIVHWLVESAKKNDWLTRLIVSGPLTRQIARAKIREFVNEAIERAEECR